jgi:hypothetical protein
MDEQQTTHTNSILGYLEVTPIFQVVSVFAIVVGLLSSLNTLNFPPELYVLGLAIIGVAVFFSARSIVRRQRAKSLPVASVQFNPFPGSESWKPWAREKTTDELAEIVERNSDRHVLVTAPSGNGKSVMVNTLLPDKLSDYEALIMDDYADVVPRLLDKLCNISNGDARTKLIKAIAALERTSIGASELAVQIKEAVLTAIGGRKIVFIFDQVERYFIRSEQMSSKDYVRFSNESEVLKSILDALIESSSARSVFAIRSEHVFGSLVNLFNTSLNGSQLREQICFYFLWGVNATDDEGEYVKIRAYLGEKFNGAAISSKVLELSNIESQQRANTFVLNLAGYVFENWSKGSKFSKRLSAVHVPESDLIDILLEAAYDGYVAAGHVSARSHFDAVLLSMASENRSSGLACEVERIAGLSHYPVDEVAKTIQYLVACGLAQEDTNQGVTVFRLNHDRVADRILKSEQLDLHPRASDAVRHLSENKVPTEKMIAPDHFPKSLELEFRHFSDISYFPVVLFVIYGIIRLLWPTETFDLLSPLIMAIGDFTGIYPPSYYVNPIFYVPHFITMIAWISLGDRINRSYLRHVQRGPLQWFANVATMMGVFLSVAVSFTPQLFVVPIVFGGTILGTCLLAASENRMFGGEMKIVTRQWGLRSIMNVMVVLVFGLATANFYAGDTSAYLIPLRGNISTETQLFIGILVESMVLLWFWQHIGAEQNNRRVWSANLAYFDKGRHR